MCEPISRRLRALPFEPPAHGAERVLGDLEPGRAHPYGDLIGGAAMLRREEQADQPIRLGRDRAERIDHRFGTHAECVNLGWGKR